MDTKNLNLYKYTVSEPQINTYAPDIEVRDIIMENLNIKFPYVLLKRPGKKEIEVCRSTIVASVKNTPEKHPYLFLANQIFPGPLWYRVIRQMIKDVHDSYKNLSMERGLMPVGCVVAIYNKKWQQNVIGTFVYRFTGPYVIYKPALSFEKGMDHIIEFIKHWDFEEGEYIFED